MLDFFKKIFKFPSPKELGLSKSNYLPLRKLTPEVDSFSWEDYDDYIKNNYPIKYFLLETIFNFIKYKIYYKIYFPIHKVYYFLICHIFNSKKYHLLDLRQPNNERSVDHYRYGWIDIPEKILYANFNLLKEFIENSNNINFENFSEEELKNDPGIRQQKFVLDEAREIYTWWKVERKKDLYIIENLYNDYLNATNSKNMILKNEINSIIKAKESSVDYKTDDMLQRLLKIRKGLWY